MELSRVEKRTLNRCKIKASMKSSLAILKREEVVAGRAEAGDIHHQARRVRRQGAPGVLEALLDHQGGPSPEVIVAVEVVAARAALAGLPGE